MLCFDIDNDGDDDYSMSEAKEALKDYKALIIPTKSHLIPKSGKGVKERFRILIACEPLPVMSGDKYANIMNNIIDTFDFGGIDQNANKDVSRFYYPSTGDYNDRHFYTK